MAEFLFLAHRIPYPPNRGDKIRSWHMLRHLAGLGRVHLACFADDEEDAAHLDELKAELGNRLGETHVEIRRTGKLAGATRAIVTGRPVSLTLFDSDGMRSFVSRQLAKPGVSALFVFSSQMAQFVPRGIAQRFVMDFVDMDSAKFAEYGGQGRGPVAWINRREGRRLLAFERETTLRADVSLFVSAAESELFRREAGLPHADIRAIQNGVDLEFFDPTANFSRLSEAERGEGPLILFTGQMDYRPNVDAVRFFAEEVLPLVRSEMPNASFAIVGRNPASEVHHLDGDGVRVIGAVPDVRSWLAAADAVVAPLRIARGVQNKVLEAMAMARPVVASPAAFEGIDAIEGGDLRVAGSAEEQSRAVLDLLRDPGLGRIIGTAARRRMEAAYRWEKRLEPMAEIMGVPHRRAAA